MSENTAGESPPDESASTESLATRFIPPKRIGRYRIFQRIGEGGMGEVFLAEQDDPRRKVALKIIKRGMDTTRVIARFEAERQALALMDHPNIAKVFDAGATRQGRPYFVMEYVKGVPITQHCDRNRLTTAERLELFIQTCEGVQHAHQKAVIHRDIKPSNVLVTIQDGNATPKIIDFGVAKATAHRLAKRTLLTETGVLVGTPEYMSPEQAEMTAQDIDTRTDVYSLGVVLYELLAGGLPFDSKELREAGLDEIRRRIREEEPAKPSTRITTQKDGVADCARRRRTDTRSLVRQLRGDLDWITMKALEKDRGRRYASASELATDLRRHLRHQPVMAGPPGTVYRLGKFVRRHQIGVAVGVVAFMLMGTFAVRERFQASQIARERDRANWEAETSKEVSDFLVGLFEVADPSEARGNTVTAREILDKGSARIERELSAQPQVQARLMSTMGMVYRSLGLYRDAEPLLINALEKSRQTYGEQHPEVVGNLTRLAWLYKTDGRPEEALPLCREAVAIAEGAPVGMEAQLGEALTALATVIRDGGDYEEARPIYERALEVRERALGADHVEYGWTLYHLGWLLNLTGEYAEAKQTYERALSIVRKERGPDDPQVAWFLNDLAVVLQNMGDYVQARPLLEQVLVIQENALGPDHPDLGATLNNLGILHWSVGDYDAAREAYERALSIRERALGANHLAVAECLNNLALLSMAIGDTATARPLYERALAVNQAALGPDHPDVALAMDNLGTLLMWTGDEQAARPLLERSLEIRRSVLGPEHRDVAMSLRSLGELAQRAGDYTGARRQLEQAARIAEASLGSEHPNLAPFLSSLATTCAITGETDEATLLEQRALGILEESLGPDNIKVAASLWRLARFHLAEGNRTKAESRFKRSLAIKENVRGADHPVLAYDWACYHALVEDRAGAIRFLRRAIDLGYSQQEITSDPDLDFLRRDPEFEAIVAEVKRWSRE